MSARTGAEFLKGLKGGREVWVEGEKVADVTSHPAFAGAAHALAEVFDLQHEAADVCLMPDPETGEPINVSHMLPRSKADLEAAQGAGADQRIFHGADGPYARLYERDLCRLRRPGRRMGNQR